MYQNLLLWFGFGLCHQLPERSFLGGGVQVPVCARDTGIYVGFVISIVMIALVQRNRPRELPSAPVSVLLGLFVLSMALDGVSSYAGLRETTNVLRLVTGLLAGYAMGAVASPLINDVLWRRASSERVLGTARSLGIWLLSLPATFAMVLWVAPLFGPVYPVLVVASVLATLTVVNLLVVCLFRRFEGRAEKLWDAWVPIGIAFACAWLEVAASAGLKLVLVRLVGG